MTNQNHRHVSVLVVVLAVVQLTSAVSTFYAAGGYNATDRLDTVLAYSIATNTWSFLPSMREPVWGGEMAILKDDNNHPHMYVGGNWDNIDNSARVMRFKLGVSTEWKYAGEMEHKRADHIFVAVGDHIYAAGGYDSYGGSVSAERSNSGVGHWDYIDTPLYPRGYAGAVGIDGILYQCGGQHWISEYDNLEILDTCEKYNPDVGSWQSIASMPAGRYQFTAMVNQAGTGFYVVGGSLGGDDILADETWEYTISTNTWSTISVLTGNSALARRWGGGFVRGDYINIFGGENGADYEHYTAIATSNAVRISTGAITSLAPMPYAVAEFASGFV